MGGRRLTTFIRVCFFKSVSALPVLSGTEKGRTATVAAIASVPQPAALGKNTNGGAAAPVGFFSPSSQVRCLVVGFFQIIVYFLLWVVIHSIPPYF